MVRTCCRRHIFDSYFYKAKVSNEIALLEQGLVWRFTLLNPIPLPDKTYQSYLRISVSEYSPEFSFSTFNERFLLSLDIERPRGILNK